MPLLGFKKQFAPLVEEGQKRQTIRAKRRDGRNPHAGETLFLYTGLRTKSCRKLGISGCKSVPGDHDRVPRHQCRGGVASSCRHGKAGL